MAVKIRVCLATWAPFLGGSEVAAERLAVGLREAGCEVFVVLRDRGETWRRMQSSGLRCFCLPLAFTDKWRFWRYLRAQRQLRRLLVRERPDVIHANDLPTSHMVAEAAGQLGIPRVCHHRWYFETAGLEWLNKFGAERHLFVSQALMDQLVAASPRLKGSSRSVVYDGLPLPPVPSHQDRQIARRELHLPCDKVIVTIAGQVMERKGIADLIRAWVVLAPDLRQRSHLLVVGDDLADRGAYRRAMEQLAAELEVPAQFVGFQKNVDRWLTASDIVAVPSHVEPLGNATLEAMALGLPVVGGAAGGIPEMIAHGQTGLLVPPRSPADLAAALDRLIRNPDLRREFGRAARKQCEAKFSLQAHVSNILAQYQLALQERAA